MVPGLATTRNIPSHGVRPGLPPVVALPVRLFRGDESAHPLAQEVAAASVLGRVVVLARGVRQPDRRPCHRHGDDGGQDVFGVQLGADAAGRLRFGDGAALVRVTLRVLDELAVGGPLEPGDGGEPTR